jgi:hypothetical protein
MTEQTVIRNDPNDKCSPATGCVVTVANPDTGLQASIAVTEGDSIVSVGPRAYGIGDLSATLRDLAFQTASVAVYEQGMRLDLHQARAVIDLPGWHPDASAERQADVIRKAVEKAHTWRLFVGRSDPQRLFASSLTKLEELCRSADRLQLDFEVTCRTRNSDPWWRLRMVVPGTSPDPYVIGRKSLHTLLTQASITELITGLGLDAGLPDAAMARWLDESTADHNNGSVGTVEALEAALRECAADTGRAAAIWRGGAWHLTAVSADANGAAPDLNRTHYKANFTYVRQPPNLFNEEQCIPSRECDKCVNGYRARSCQCAANDSVLNSRSCTHETHLEQCLRCAGTGVVYAGAALTFFDDHGTVRHVNLNPKAFGHVGLLGRDRAQAPEPYQAGFWATEVGLKADTLKDVGKLRRIDSSVRDGIMILAGHHGPVPIVEEVLAEISAGRPAARAIFHAPSEDPSALPRLARIALGLGLSIRIGLHCDLDLGRQHHESWDIRIAENTERTTLLSGTGSMPSQVSLTAAASRALALLEIDLPRLATRLARQRWQPDAGTASNQPPTFEENAESILRGLAHQMCGEYGGTVYAHLAQQGWTLYPGTSEDPQLWACGATLADAAAAAVTAGLRKIPAAGDTGRGAMSVAAVAGSADGQGERR